jgi:hypothetical protein
MTKNCEQIRIWKEAVMAKFKVLSRYLPEDTEKNPCKTSEYTVAEKQN